MDICILLKTIFVNNYISKMMKIKEKNNLHRTTQTKSNTWKSGWKNVRWSINLLTEYWQAKYTVTSQMWPIHQILAKYTKIWGVGALFSLLSRTQWAGRPRQKCESFALASSASQIRRFFRSFQAPSHIYTHIYSSYMHSKRLTLFSILYTSFSYYIHLLQ